MKRLFLFLSIFITVNLLTPKSSATSNPVISDIGIQFGFFYSSLAPHGEWIEVESGTRVWRPFDLPHQWRPYLIGRWVWTDEYGWYWMSSESFGWITYHYGRWYDDDFYGWIWMPDDVWAPAWVEWRYDNDYIGWAPLPPYARFRMGRGIQFTTHWRAPAHYWNIIRYDRFGSSIRYRDTAPQEYARHFIRSGINGQQYGMDRERIINRGVDRATIEHRGNIHFTGTEVREIREQSGERITQSSANQAGERIEVYRPTRDEMHRGTERIETHRGERTLSIDMNKIVQQRIESRPSPGRLPRNDTRVDEPRRDMGLQQVPQQPGRSHEYTPQMREQQGQRTRQEKRRELIQRHERPQNPTPPAVRERPQQRIEQRNERSRIAPSEKAAQERSSEIKSERRRGRD